MRMRPREERSRLAGWSSYLAALAIPVLIIAAVGHRAGLMDVTSTYSVMALGYTLAAAAVVAALGAFVAVWREGSKGTGAALRGLVVGLVILAMPALGRLGGDHPCRGSPTSRPTPPIRRISSPRYRIAGPRTRPSSIPAMPRRRSSARRIPTSCRAAIRCRPPASTSRRAPSSTSAAGRCSPINPPSDDDPSGSIEAVAQTLVFGFRQDVAIRIVPDGDGTRVDMRSASRSAAHDLGSDAERVRHFLADLDNALQGVTGS